MPYCVNGGVRTYYEVAGEGPPALFIHANPCDHRMWLYQVAHFSAAFRTVALDLRAYGRSDHHTAPYGFAALAGDVARVAETAGPGPAVVFGASIGAKLAFRHAVDHRDRVRALVLVGGNAFRGASYDSRIVGYRRHGVVAYRPRHLAELVAPGFLDTPRGRYLADMLCEDSDRLSAEAIARLFESFDGVDLAGVVAELDLPVLIVNGEHDLSLPGARRTAALIPGARHAVIDGAGHLCNLERPDAFDQLVAEFLRGKI